MSLSNHSSEQNWDALFKDDPWAKIMHGQCLIAAESFDYSDSEWVSDMAR